jgi:hypothetical protein
MRQPKVSEYRCGLIVALAALSLYSYHVRELLAALALFSVVFFPASLVLLGVFLTWCASEQVAIWIRPASNNMVAFSRRLMLAYAKH